MKSFRFAWQEELEQVEEQINGQLADWDSYEKQPLYGKEVGK